MADGVVLHNEKELRAHFADSTKEEVVDEMVKLVNYASPEIARLRDALENVTDPNECSLDHNGYCQEHYSSAPCVQLVARQALMSMKQEKSDTLPGHVDGRDTSTSCSETAGTEPTCAPTAFQVRRLEDVARAVSVPAVMDALNQASERHDHNGSQFFATARAIVNALAALRDSGWRG